MFGYGPLPVEGLRLSGPTVRTWHFLQALRAAGHEVCLIADRIHGAYPDDLPDLLTRDYDGWRYHSLSEARWHHPETLRPLVKAAQADCAIAVNTPACMIAAEAVGDLPLWGDLNGSIMAEAQMKALVYGDDGYLGHFWQQERRALDRVDKFSTVSERQQWALIGELGLWGRLNQWTSGYEFAVTIPNAVETAPFPPPTRHVIRGLLAADDAFVILYSGGYNTWADVDTLFGALEQVMAERPEIVFVSTGGRIEGHDDLTYVRFQTMIASSRFRQRFHLCGWVPTDLLPAYYLESNIGVSTDRFSYEAQLGSRNRILDWMRAGLPSVSSSLTELSAQIVTAGAGLTYRPGSVTDLADCLRRCAADRQATAHMGERACALLAERFTFSVTATPLIEWVARPSHAPDYGHDVPRLVNPGQPVARAVVQAVQQRSLGLALALRLWPLVARVTDAVGLHRLQKGLIALGMCALRLNRPPYRVSYEQVQIPETMLGGQTYSGSVTIYNAGRSAWPTARQQENGVNLAYHWRSAAGQMLIREGARSTLPEALPGGARVTLPLMVTAPVEAGVYRLELDMLREGITWFSEVGAPGPQIMVTVSDGDPSGTRSNAL